VLAGFGLQYVDGLGDMSEPRPGVSRAARHLTISVMLRRRTAVRGSLIEFLRDGLVRASDVLSR
jgi:hypothetical protein